MPVNELIALIEQHLRDQHPGGANLSIQPDGIRHEEDRWYVPVKPDKQPAKRFEYYEAAASVETQLQLDNNVTVLFTPMVADVAEV